MKFFRRELEVIDEEVSFEPAPDITAYELALILKGISSAFGSSLDRILVSPCRPIPSDLSRHFRKKEDGQ